MTNFKISTVAPVRYAHLAATLIGTFTKFDDMSDTSSNQGISLVGSVMVPEWPRLHTAVGRSMFFG